MCSCDRAPAGLGGLDELEHHRRAPAAVTGTGFRQVKNWLHAHVLPRPTSRPAAGSPARLAAGPAPAPAVPGSRGGRCARSHRVTRAATAGVTGAYNGMTGPLGDWASTPQLATKRPRPRTSIHRFPSVLGDHMGRGIWVAGQGTMRVRFPRGRTSSAFVTPGVVSSACRSRSIARPRCRTGPRGWSRRHHRWPTCAGRSPRCRSRVRCSRRSTTARR